MTLKLVSDVAGRCSHVGRVTTKVGNHSNWLIASIIQKFKRVKTRRKLWESKEWIGKSLEKILINARIMYYYDWINRHVSYIRMHVHTFTDTHTHILTNTDTHTHIFIYIISNILHSFQCPHYATFSLTVAWLFRIRLNAQNQTYVTSLLYCIEGREVGNHSFLWVELILSSNFLRTPSWVIPICQKTTFQVK